MNRAASISPRPMRCQVTRSISAVWVLALFTLLLGLLLGSTSRATQALGSQSGPPFARTDQETCNEPGNLAPNPSFECPGAAPEEALDWESETYKGRPALLYRTQMTARTGSYSVAIDSGATGSSSRWQTIPITAHAGRLYQFSVWVKADRLSDIATVSLTFWSGVPSHSTLLAEAVHPQGTGNTNGEWVHLVHSQVAPTGTVYIRLECHLYEAGIVYFDDASIREDFVGLGQVDVPATVQPGDTLTYLLTFSNTGTITATNVWITDTFDPRVSLDAAVPPPAGGSGLVRYWVFPSLPPGASGQITLTTTVKFPLPDDISLYNQVEWTCDQMSPLSNTEDTPVRSFAELVITKTDSPDPVEAGQDLTYTIAYTNSGTLTMTGVVLSEFYPLYTQFESASPPPSDPPQNTHWQMPDLPPGASQSVQIRLNTSLLARGEVLNYVELDSNETEPQVDAEPTTFIEKKPCPSIDLNPDSQTIPVEPVPTIAQPLFVGNTGSCPLTAIHLDTSEPPNWKGEIRIEPSAIDSLAVGTWSAVSLIVEPATDEISGAYTVHITATSGKASASAIANLVVGQRVDLELEPDSMRYAHPGDVITFTHWLTNLGNYTDTFSIEVHSSLPWSIRPLPVTQCVLGLGQACVVPMTIEVPPAAGMDLENKVIISATSSAPSMPEPASDFAVDVIIIRPWDVYLPLVLKPYVSPDPFCSGDFSRPFAPCWTATTNPSVERICASGDCFARLGKAEDDALCGGKLTPGTAVLAQTFTPSADTATLSFDYEIHTQDVLSDRYDTLVVYVDSTLVYSATQKNPQYGCDPQPMVVRGAAEVAVDLTMGEPVTLRFHLINGDTWFNTYADIDNVAVTYSLPW